jgi:subtilisin family serine protease
MRALIFVLLVCGLDGALGQSNGTYTTHTSYTTYGERLLVKPRPGADLTALHQTLGSRLRDRFSAIGDLQIVEVPAGTSVIALVAAYQQSGLVQYAEPDRVVHALLDPNDFHFQNGDLWHVKNLGQYGGVVDADLDATDAWDTQTDAPNIIVAVLDTGIRASHEDLAPNLWRNPGEIPGNGLDDDGDGYVDDVIGINTIANNGNPNDDHGHGSHVSGIIGAAGNNFVGVAGVCWRVQIMACKFLGPSATGLVSDAVKCIDFARSKGAKIINLSWGDPTFGSQALYDAIASARNAGIILVAACGNSGNNNDAIPLYPASYDLDNIIAVAATDRSDFLASFSCYGLASVDLGAPGDPVYSCWNNSDSAYQYLAGTSMAAPCVAGACALVWARFPGDNYQQIINRILANVDPLPALAGKCVSGGRLNVNRALTAPSIGTVSVTATDPTATIGTADTAEFTLTRAGSTAGSLVVNFQFTGSAVKWEDYRRPEGDMPESLTIPAGSNSATLTILALTNVTGANPLTVTLNLSPSLYYVVGASSNATANLLGPGEVIGGGLVIRNIGLVASNQIAIQWTSVPGLNYEVQFKSTLAATNWQSLSGTINASGTNTAWTNNVGGVGQRFYVVRRVN